MMQQLLHTWDVYRKAMEEIAHIRSDRHGLIASGHYAATDALYKTGDWPVEEKE